MRLWSFGDSFTYGYMCKPGSEYFDMFPPKKIWPELLSDYMGFELKNISEPGLSNHDITKNLITNLKDIKKGDMVIVSDSSPFRLLSFKREDLKWDNVFMPLYEDKVIVDYLHQEILPYEESWTNYNREIVISLFESLQGTACHYWSWKLRDKFESIRHHTKNKVKDDHWSWNGHQQFYEFMKGVVSERDE